MSKPRGGRGFDGEAQISLKQPTAEAPRRFDGAAATESRLVGCFEPTITPTAPAKQIEVLFDSLPSGGVFAEGKRVG